MGAEFKRGESDRSWTEVTIGAALSVVIGATLGITFLVFKPVTIFKDGESSTVTAKAGALRPAEERSKSGSSTAIAADWKTRPGDVVYFEGSMDASKAKLAGAKRKMFAAGGSVLVDENELNALVGIPVPAPGPAVPAPGAENPPAAIAPPPPAPAAEAAAAAPGTGGFGVMREAPNFRIKEGELQIGLPLKFAAFGYDTTVVVQARGQFVKRGVQFGFEPSRLLVGSCPLDSLPSLRSWVGRKILNAVPVPQDIQKAWGELIEVAVVGSALMLTMP
ncbi:MAG: hypothetical protein CK538_08775 [Opitutia bacterium]|nr:MAG: hypothetical protein CK538_08775 [Opitutae bacterium]